MRRESWFSHSITEFLYRPFQPYHQNREEACNHKYRTKFQVLLVVKPCFVDMMFNYTESDVKSSVYSLSLSLFPTVSFSNILIYTCTPAMHVKHTRKSWLLGTKQLRQLTTCSRLSAKAHITEVSLPERRQSATGRHKPTVDVPVRPLCEMVQFNLATIAPTSKRFEYDRKPFDLPKIR